MNKIYDGVKTIDCELGNNIVIGEDSFLKKCVLGDYVQINRRNILEDASLGEYTYTGANTILKHTNVGRYCSISWNVSATGNTHDYKRASAHPFTHLSSFGFLNQGGSLEYETITIGNDVWIGANTCILAGITIGNGAIIGAGGVVTKDIPPFAIAVGNPAKVIKYRFSDDIARMIIKAEWWNWPHSLIKEHIDLFHKEMSVDIAKALVSISKGV